ncbi:MAG TPA: transglycosylase domain-containing protein [Acidimicrobiia bacterium]|nr:transglycosylase domain-containing protein [Acidimicrobiia bacterium]
MRPLTRSLITVLVAIVVGGLAVGACLAALIPGTVEVATAHHYTAEQVGNLKTLAQPSTIYWADGVTPMGKFGTEARDPISSLAEVPKMVQNAVIATEDRSFWTNDGIDLGAVFRAFLTNVTSGKIEQGGSTITQQLVKNRILTSKRDVNRKIKEIEDALRLNEKFSKEKIFVEYLNTVYFGSGSYGIKAAASRFFYTWDPGAPYPRGKHLDELTIGEAALLAGMISNPSTYDPFTYPDRAIRRRADVLRGMVSEHYITQAQADAANNEPLPNIKPPATSIVGHDFLTTEVLQDLLKDPRLGNTEDERRDKILKGGLKIYTTFDPNLQHLAEDATTNAKPQMGADWVSSLVSIDPNSGAVRAMVSGEDWNDSQTNIATSPDGRQTGSTFKVITLATALANGYSPADTVDGSSPCSVAGFDGYTVNDEPGSGTYSIADATSGSVNCAFVRIATSVGEDKVIDMAHKMGITKSNLQPYLTLTLGVFAQNTETMANVMATVASGGVHHTPYVVQKIVFPDGKVLDTTSPGDQVLSPDVAACEQNVLRGVVTGGTGTGAEVPGHTVFGKTGTTDSQGDAWFIGATPQLATAVWFGNWRRVEGGAGFGGSSAAPIFQAFMSGALANEPNVPLPAPGPVCGRSGQNVIDTGGRNPNAPVVPFTPQLPTVQQQPTTPTPTAPPATAPAPAQPQPGTGNGKGNPNGNGAGQ